MFPESASRSNNCHPFFPYVPPINILHSIGAAELFELLHLHELNRSCLELIEIYHRLLHKLSTNKHGMRALMRWCIASFGFMLLIFSEIFANCSMNSLKGSSFSWRIFMRAREVRQWGLLVMNWMPKRVVDVLKESIKLDESLVNQLRVGLSVMLEIYDKGFCLPRCIIPSGWWRHWYVLLGW